MADIEKESDVQWVKHGTKVSTNILGKDIAVLSNGNYITFLETSRPEKKEIFYHANNEVRGDGVTCVCTHKTLPLFALAEACRNPRILIISYPNFEVYKSFESSGNTNYIALKFSEMEYLIALTGRPDFRLVIWNWRTSEKLCSEESQMKGSNQCLCVSTTSPIQILQSTLQDRRIIFWELNICHKKTMLNKIDDTLPQVSLPPYGFCYGADGELYYVDSQGAFFSMNTENRLSMLHFSSDGLLLQHTPCITWYRGGLVFSTPGELQFWKRKSPDGWTKIWSHFPKIPFTKLLSSSVKDHLVGVTQWCEIMVIKGETQVDCFASRSYGSDFEFLCFIYPVGDYFLTFGNHMKTFSVWNKANGHRVSNLVWQKKKVNAVQSNPRWPYAAISTEDGKLSIINAYNPGFIIEMNETALTKKSLDAIRFNKTGTYFCAANYEIGEFFLLQLTGKLEVVSYIKILLRIVDFAIQEKDDSDLELLVVPMSQICCRSGHVLMLYHFDDKTKTFSHVKDVTMPHVTTSITLSSISQKEIFAVPHRSRYIYVMNIQSGKLIQSFVSGHQMKIIYTKCVGDYLISYGYDGIVIIKAILTKKCATIFSSHHRLAGGVSLIAVDPYMKYAITLGMDGSLLCVILKKTGKTEKKAEYEAMLASSEFKNLLLTPVISEKARLKAMEKLSQGNLHEMKGVSSTVGITKFIKEPPKVWTDLKDEETRGKEELNSRREKEIIYEEIEHIRNKISELLNENISNPPERQLSVQAFDLDKASRRKKIEDGKSEREKEKQMLLASMKTLNKITDIIKNNCWKSVAVKGKELRGITAGLVVQSYPLLPDKPPTKLKSWLGERIKIENFFRRGDFFEPWVPRSDSSLELHIKKKFEVPSLDVMHTVKTIFEEEQMEDEKTKADILELSRKYVWTGTSSHEFIDVDPNHYSQFELMTFYQSHQEIYLIENDIKKLMLWFNKEFEEAFLQKEIEMAFVNEKNNRFRYIIDELSFFGFSPQICKTQIYDPQWAPEEIPEMIMTVNDNEVGVTKYITDSEMEIIKLKELEEEKLREMLAADDFREKALMTMMDGVLEKLWEGELKKDVPKPKCMLEKTPENYTEEDLKTIKNYDEAVKFLQSERDRYRKLLETEWNKTILILKDSCTKFDEKVAKLHLLKLKVESAIGQEILKALRIRQRCFKRIEMDRKEENIKLSLYKNEKKIISLTAELNKLVEMLNECKSYYEMLQNKDKNLDKNFKREFPDYSPIVTEQLYKLSKKRPKLAQKPAIYASVLNDMGRCALTNSKPEYMPIECIQYLKDIDALDAQSNAPAAVHQQTWELACKIRRQKIETELKLRACAIELAEAEATVFTYQKALKIAKDYHGQLQNNLQAVREEKMNSSTDYQIQLVLKKGVIEVPLTGQISDFSEAVLVTQSTLLEVNKAIQKTGLQKLKAMQKAANFRKGIIYKEWEHQKLRMEIEDLQNQLETVEKLQVLKELQAILVARARGFSDEKGFLYLENEIAKVKEKYKKLEEEMDSKISNFDKKIQKIIKSNRELDDKITALNVEINELNLEYDEEMDRKVVAASEKKMKKIWNRSKLVRKIQEQHNEILLLQTELELLRLKTYPTIKSRLH